MFLKFFKNFSAKRILNKSSLNVNTEFSNKPIQKLGLLVDETFFAEKDKVVQLLINNGIEAKNITVLAFKNKYKKKEIVAYPHYSKEDVSWLGTIENKDALNFIAQEFDLLISFYDQKQIPLVIVTHQSKADFKVGFAEVDKRLNHFMINTAMENYTIFVEELFKYLRILNKIK
jgi:hypothetical protein